MHLQHAAMTHVGNVRENNEDSHLVVPSVLYAVADGMGGHPAGDVASDMAIKTIYNYKAVFPREPHVENVLRVAFNAAHNVLCDNMNARPDRQGMGTTLVALAFRNDHAFVGHVGDSRCYLVRGETAEQLTEDHRVGRGLANCLGTRRNAYSGVTVTLVAAQVGDLFVLCSDGLSDYLPSPKTLALLRRESPAPTAHALLQHALAAGGHDNITVIVIEVLP